MIAGLILSHLGDSQYALQLSYDVAKANALIDWNNATINSKNDDINAQQTELNTLRGEVATNTATLNSKQAQLVAEKSKPTYPGDGYDFKDLALIASLESQISQLNQDIQNALDSYNIQSASLVTENQKPKAPDDNPTCDEAFFCQQRADDIQALMQIYQQNALDAQDELKEKSSQLQAEKRKLPSLADAGPSYYKSADLVKTLTEEADKLTQTITEDKLSIKQLQVHINMLKVEVLTLQKKNEFIDKTKGEDQQITAYSNVYDDTLTGLVPVHLVAGNIDQAVIITDDGITVDGLLSRAMNISKEHCFVNFALMPGWLAWKQPYAVGLVNTIDAQVTSQIYPMNNKLSLVKDVRPHKLTAMSDTTEYDYHIDDKPLVKLSDSGVPTYNGWYEKPRNLLPRLVAFIAATQPYDANKGIYGVTLNTSTGEMSSILRLGNHTQILESQYSVNGETYYDPARNTNVAERTWVDDSPFYKLGYPFDFLGKQVTEIKVYPDETNRTVEISYTDSQGAGGQSTLTWPDSWSWSDDEPNAYQSQFDEPAGYSPSYSYVLQPGVGHEVFAVGKYLIIKVYEYELWTNNPGKLYGHPGYLIIDSNLALHSAPLGTKHSMGTILMNAQYG